MAGTSQVFLGGMERQHAVILESIWVRDSIITHFPLLADGTPYSSSDLLYFTLLLPFYLNKLFQVELPFLSFVFFGQKFSKSNSPSLFSSDKKILSSNSILQNYSKTIPISVLAAKTFQSRKNILSPFFFLTSSKFPPFCLPISYTCLRSLNGVH